MSEQQTAGQSRDRGTVEFGTPPLGSRSYLDMYRAQPQDTRRRWQTIFGGGLAGLGVGIALAWTLGIFQRAHPQGPVAPANGSFANLTNAYPPMAGTVFVVVIVAGLAIGLGVGLIAAAFIPHEDRTQSS
jgi:hypothetical protein